jgi:sugar transferase EpsL
MRTCKSCYRKTGKRVLDVVLTVVFLLPIFPFLILLALLVWIFLGRPVLFRQERPGLYGKPFTLLKFRTMRDLVGFDGKLLPDRERLTRFGKFLRRSSLDEFPELFNVLNGKMSLVGPRPLLMEYLSLYTPEQMRRHEVKPGITGWAQVNGRNDISWKEKFVLDMRYVENQSLGLDINILWRTIIKVLKREGISQKGNETMEKFTGSED